MSEAETDLPDRIRGNVLALYRRDAHTTVTDERVPPGGPPRIGDRVTLAAARAPTDRPSALYEYIGVRVTAVEGETFRGELIHPPFYPPLRGTVPAGAPLTFEAVHVFGLYAE
jgi:hypothetical protein